MENRVCQLACAIIGSGESGRPADARLRLELRKQHGLSRAQSRGIAHAVFAYYRWLGWLDRSRPLPDQIERANTLSSQFLANPDFIPDAELLVKAIPAWVTKVMETPAEWVRTLQREPILWLRARRPDDVSTLAARLRDARVPQLGTGSETSALSYHGEFDLFRTPEFQKGQFEVQDIASQAVGWICAPVPGETWWDACAGEGGKMLHLSDLMQNRGLIWATDRAAWRLQRLKRRAARAQVFNYRAARWDASEKLPTQRRLDGVLVDAPCTGIGTWQRNPEARWTTSLRDLEELSLAQKTLLQRVARSVKPGGKLVYSVCTLSRPETLDVARDFEGSFPDFEPMACANPFEPQAVPAARQWWWPQRTEGNGMFVAIWRRATARFHPTRSSPPIAALRVRSQFQSRPFDKSDMSE